MNPDGLDLTLVYCAKHSDCVISGFGWNSALGNTPQTLDFMAELVVHNGSMSWQDVTQSTTFSHTSTGVWLTSK